MKENGEQAVTDVCPHCGQEMPPSSESGTVRNRRLKKLSRGGTGGRLTKLPSSGSDISQTSDRPAVDSASLAQPESEADAPLDAGMDDSIVDQEPPARFRTVEIRCRNCKTRACFKTDVKLKWTCTECGEVNIVRPNRWPLRALVAGLIFIAAAGLATVAAVVLF